jgi:arsenite methyltransferase
VLERAAIRAGDVVLGVGAGDGLIGFGALEQVGAPGRVIFSDISADLLDECRRRVGGDRAARSYGARPTVSTASPTVAPTS